MYSSSNGTSARFLVDLGQPCLVENVQKIGDTVISHRLGSQQEILTPRRQVTASRFSSPVAMCDHLVLSFV